jgi:hypothetical protein
MIVEAYNMFDVLVLGMVRRERAASQLGPELYWE